MPSTSDLVTVEETLSFLQKQNASDVPDVTPVITRASLWIEQATERLLTKRTMTSLRLTGPDVPKLYLPAWPVDASATVTISLDGTSQTVWLQEADGDPDDFDVELGSDDPWDERWGMRNHFYRDGGWQVGTGWIQPGPWLSGPPSPFPAQPVLPKPYRLLLSYTGGYDPVPEDLKLGALYLIQKLWRDLEKGASSSVVTPTGGSVTYLEPDFPVECVMLIKPYARNPHLVGVTGVKRTSRFAVQF